jgi:hypothetical protein
MLTRTNFEKRFIKFAEALQEGDCIGMCPMRKDFVTTFTLEGDNFIVPKDIRMKRILCKWCKDIMGYEDTPAAASNPCPCYKFADAKERAYKAAMRLEEKYYASK